MRSKTASKISLSVQSSYQQIAEEFSESRRFSWKEYQLALPYIQKADKILDAGCGNGRFFECVKDFPAEYSGLDNSAALVSQAKRLYPRGFFHLGDFASLPFLDGFFDVCVCFSSLHHVPSSKLRDRALEEMLRVVKIGGFLIVSVWNLFQPSKKFQRARFQALTRFFYSFGNFSRRDLFLSWGQEKLVKRYYYAFKAREFRDLFRKKNLEIIDYFSTADGDKIELKKAKNFMIIVKKIAL